MFGDIQDYVRAYIDMSVSGNILFFTLGQHFKHFRFDSPVSVMNGTNISYIQDRRLSISIPKLFVFIGVDQISNYKSNPLSTVLHCPAITAPNDFQYDNYSTMALHDEFIFQQMTLHDEPMMLSTLCSTFYEEAKLPYDCITITSEEDNPISKKTEYLQRTTEHFLNLTELL
jgi:hypothetical protein